MQSIDIENCNIRMDICDICEEIEEEDPVNNITESLNNCELKDPYTIYVAKLVERFIKEMKIEKIQDNSDKNTLNIYPPNWFNSLDNRTKKLIIDIIEPVSEYYMNNQ